MAPLKTERLPYAELPEWNDVTPIPQKDEGQVLVPILYNHDYKEAMEYFRAIVKAEEYSERVLALTEHIIRMNPAHYSVWQYRYRTLLQIKAPLDKELDLINSMMGQNLKTYQIWHHRRLLQGHIREPFTELAFIEKTLTPLPHRANEDSSEDESEDEANPKAKAKAPPKEKPAPVDTKNYHTWAYRQWVLAEFNSPELWAGELDFVDMMLRHDVRNNSAWHHRFFVTWESGVREGELDREEVLRREIDYAKEKISLVPNNASAWNYLRGILQKMQTPFSTLEAFVIPYTVPQPKASAKVASSKAAAFLADPHSLTSSSDASRPDSSAIATPTEETVDLENPLPSATAELPCALAIEFLADIYVEKASQASAQAKDDATQKAVELFESLATTYDTIRRKYWAYRQARARASKEGDTTAQGHPIEQGAH